MAFFNITSPHQQTKRRTPEIMQLVILALVPGILVHSYLFGSAIFVQIVLAIFTALIAESVFLKLRKRPILNSLKDYSAVVTAILLAISIPSLAPWWIIVIGTLFAILIVKNLYGGLGQNIFNPAMAGYVVLLISFPVQMTAWLPIQSMQAFPVSFHDILSLIFTGFSIDGYTVTQIKTSIDGYSIATPLETIRNAIHSGSTISETLKTTLFSSDSLQGSQWVNLAFLAGGLFLLKKRIILWYIPVSFIAAITIFSFIAFASDPDLYSSPLYHLFSGATMLGAFFILTDPVTASTTVKGRIIYGSLCALLVIIIRNVGGYPDAVAFAVLLANMCVPLIDYYTKPKAYGRKRT
ncbi:electron transport complex subunit RsxD [Psychromonas sp. RZ22]|uniref:electron transport complex subunit RsxD n=1 Tax=Psychromonas algarum TaxID=2555643 RepID=UPI0010687B70|nr:electron transport complex subunit RsxD [Psychromonas sp. RZ22]TEW53409.1 electron transport complex subunit RsxD [Psychromonas sp. RZ22]